jgi:hypothetical protein
LTGVAGSSLCGSLVNPFRISSSFSLFGIKHIQLRRLLILPHLAVA